MTSILEYEIEVQKNKDGVFIAWWSGETGEGRTQGAGQTELEAIACLCAFQEEQDGVSADWHKAVMAAPLVIDGHDVA